MMKLDVNKIAGTVIVYNPDENVINNILSYVDQVSALYIIDNSVISHSLCENLSNYSNVKFIKNFANLGIATALNTAATFAIRDGYDFLLTMDQDTALPKNMINYFAGKFNDFERIGILSPFHINDAKKNKANDARWHDVLTVMMCGNLLNLKAYEKVGIFEEKLFIDYVDHEFCLRLKKNNYRVVQDNSIAILHKLGERKIKKIIFMIFSPSNHSPFRYYFRTRNRFFVYEKYFIHYPLFVVKDFIHLFKEAVSVLLFEENKIKKFQMIYKGFSDFLRNKYGKLNTE